jgi:crotonobetainyl-CoA:carnitine CoA-transferase CaiB-like acyl-CoA transferase
MAPERHLSGHEHAAPMIPARSGPLCDVRVIDLTRALAGPYATMILADLGADVVKIEEPSGDMSRFGGPYTSGDRERFYGGYFGSINRNKRSVVIDLSTPQGRDALLGLVGEADVLVENFRAGVMDRFGLSYEVLRGHNRRLVYGAIRGFGDPRTGDSPYVDWPSFDIVAQAASGVMSYTGTASGERVAAGPSIGDLYPATVLAAGVIAAVHHARSTGEGQFVDVAMVDSLVALSESIVWRYSYTGQVTGPRGSDHPVLCPFGLYAASDGHCAIAAHTSKHWRLLCDLIGRPDLVSDPRTHDNDARHANKEFVRTCIESWTGARSRGEIVTLLAGVVPVAPLQDAADLFTDPHVEARGMLVAVDHPGSERPVVYTNTPLRFSQTPTGIYRRAPKLGEHTEEVLGPEPYERNRDTNGYC